MAVLIGACTVDPVIVDTPDNGRVTDVTLTPPATPDQGWQLAISPFSLRPGQELQQCFFFEVPYDEPVFVSHIAVAQTTGTHHMNIFRVRSVVALDGAHGDVVVDDECWKPANWADWPLVINSQNEGNVDLALPEGVAHRFEPREKIMLQTHYVNATTQVTPSVGKVLVNFDRVPANAVTAELGTAFATNQNLRVCPGQSGVTFETTCRFADKEPVTIFGANGHFHSRGRRFTMSVFNPLEGAEAPFYDNSDWAEPLFAKNLGLAVPTRGGVSYTCEFSAGPNECGNPDDNCCFTFGGKVEFQEHCNAFVYFYPRRPDTDVNCF
ncbi:MAG TPA: hypothetical protein VK540_21970 [Polyangiaceae bacterium]|nr:hypothetical protein [Polyangiaceae bacterium]